MTPLTPIPSSHDFDPPPEYLRQGPQPAPAAPTERRGGAVGRVLAVTVSLVTLSAFGGGVWLAYEQGVRKGLELAPPLVRADPSPTKIVPVDPGGLVVANQDKRVFDTIRGAAPPPRVEQLLPPAETPLPRLTPEPRVAAALAPVLTAPAPILIAPPTLAAPAAAAPNGVPVPPRAALLETAPVLGPAPATAGDGRPLALVPPANQAARPATTPAAAAGGSFRIQLGAYADAKTAMDNWDVLRRRLGETLTGLQPTVVTAMVSGSIYHRLQAGPLASSAEANQLCVLVKAGGTDCLVVRP